MKEEKLICCDWGTSNFRLYLVNSENYEIIHVIVSNQGVSDIHKKYNSHSSVSQEDFFIGFLNDQIQVLSKEAKEDVSGISVIASGMASSTIGITNVDYAILPFSLSDPQLNYKKIPSSKQCAHDIYVFGGLRSSDDVMRGEEVQLLGVTESLPSKMCICILPGTHSKHVKLENRIVTQFETFITGEVFHLLTKHSILGQSITDVKEMNEEDQIEFVKGVQKGASLNLLSSLFKTRTRDILEKVTSRQNYFYLSGLLIGSELSTIQYSDYEIILCGGDNLVIYYTIALNTLAGNKKCTVLSSNRIKKAIPIAHSILYKNLK